MTASFFLLLCALLYALCCNYYLLFVSLCICVLPPDLPLIDEFNNIKQWSAENKLKINITKTEEIVFRKLSLREYLLPQPLEGTEHVQKCKLLGIFISSSLSANRHVDNLPDYWLVYVKEGLRIYYRLRLHIFGHLNLYREQGLTDSATAKNVELAALRGVF